METYFVGIDVGSSSVKTSIYNGETGNVIANAACPEQELKIHAPQKGWAEQDPLSWWKNFIKGYRHIIDTYSIDTKKISAIGISYQMHGLVLIDKHQNILRKSIIWCDSRAVDIGASAFSEIGADRCLQSLLNSPGNFTASKLAWVKRNEPEIYEKAHRFMLPGDYIAMKLSGMVTTTRNGLSEGVFWDFSRQDISNAILGHFGFSEQLIPPIVPAIGEQVRVSSGIADELGLRNDVYVTYRAGDQPNNAFSLNVNEPGQIAAAAGTSGVIYAVSDQNTYDSKSRINTFLHVNREKNRHLNGHLLCVNGTGISYRWMKELLNTDSPDLTYPDMNEMAAQAPAGADGIQCFPFGNGAERILENKVLNAHLMHLDFNRHNTSHVIRSVMEGIIYALNLGFDILKNLDISYDTIRAGYTNLFLSETFRSIFANVTNSTVELYNTDGSAGAARGAALGAGFYYSVDQAFSTLEMVERTEPHQPLVAEYRDHYDQWKKQLNQLAS